MQTVHRWTTGELTRANAMRKTGAAWSDIGKALRRTADGVRLKIQDMRRAARTNGASKPSGPPKRDRPHDGVNTRATPPVRARMTNPTPQHRNPSLSHLTPENVRPVLALLIDDGRLSRADVERAIGRGREIARIEAELVRLRGEIAPTRPAVVKRKPFRMTPAMARARRTQGRYLGALKRFPSGAVREKAKALAKEKGVPAAVAFLNQQGE